MTDSILDSVKEALGVPVDQPAFDSELIMFINSGLSTLNQLGVGPVDGFMITNNKATWDDFLAGHKKKNDAKTHLFLSVKLMFDPPTTSFVLSAIQEQIKESGWRLMTTHAQEEWTPPVDPAEPTPTEGA